MDVTSINVCEAVKSMIIAMYHLDDIYNPADIRFGTTFAQSFSTKVTWPIYMMRTDSYEPCCCFLHIGLPLLLQADGE